MSTLFRSLPLFAALLCISGSAVEGGLCKRTSSCDGCCPQSCCSTSCCPSDYCCTCESEQEKVTRECFETECKPVVIPAVTLPCCKCSLKKLFRRCGGGCCDSGCCDSGCCGCGDGGCGQCKSGMLSKLCSKFTRCRIRCVNTYKKEEYECGTKCVCKWSATRKGGCCEVGCCNTGCCESGDHCQPACCAPTYQ